LSARRAGALEPRRFAQTSELGLTFDILLDPMESVAQLYQIRGQPSTYLLDAKHRIQNIYFGPIRFEQLSQDIHLITHS